MTTAVIPTVEDRAQLARLTRIEYEYRVILDAQQRRLDAVPEGDPIDDDDVWAEHSLKLLHAHAWEQLTGKRRALGMEA